VSAFSLVECDGCYAPVVDPPKHNTLPCGQVRTKMLNSLKRRKSTAKSSTKAPLKKSKVERAKGTATTNGESAVQPTFFSLQQLIDKPYFAYDAATDDVGICFTVLS
jgi:hypothetical protein